jgi:hypothetical protein
MHEDPMMKIKQQELKAREAVVKNPLKMNKVKKEIEAQLRREEDERKERKKLKKESKKEVKKAAKKESKEARKEARLKEIDVALPSGSPQKGGIENLRLSSGSKALSEDSLKTDQRYGLQGGRSIPSYSHDELGPSCEMRSRAKKADAVFVDRKRPRPELTDLERAERLEAMKRDAAEHDRTRVHREGAASARESNPSFSRKESDPAFLQKMGREVYLSGHIDMEERVKRNRQNHQKDLGSESFMAR